MTYAPFNEDDYARWDEFMRNLTSRNLDESIGSSLPDIDYHINDVEGNMEDIVNEDPEDIEQGNIHDLSILDNQVEGDNSLDISVFEEEYEIEYEEQYQEEWEIEDEHQRNDNEIAGQEENFYDSDNIILVFGL